MRLLKFTTVVAAILVLSAFTIEQSISWKISDGYSIKFTSKDPSGIFSKMDGDIIFDENDLSNSKFDVKVDVNSINTGNGMQNRHAKGSKWFDAKNYPFIHFVSENFKKTTTGYSVMGTMEIHGIKKDFEIPFTFKNNVFEASFPVDRTDYNIGSTKGMAKKVPHELKLDISVPVSK